MSKLAFCDYHNMVAILEKTEHNTDFHQIVDFLEASPLRKTINAAKPKAVHNAVKASSCWVLKPKNRVIDHGGGIMDQWEDFGIERDSNKSTDKGSESTGEMANSTISPVSLFVPTVAATASEKDSTTAVITTTTTVTPYTRRTRASRGVVMTSSSPIPINIPSINKEDKGKGIMTEPAKPTKQKVQEQMSEQLARELEEEFAQENQRLREQAARDTEIARLHTEGELKMMIDELDRSNEVIAKHLKEYAQAEDVLSLEDKIELIIKLAKYQKDLA
ncbi:hypothetical protein Tco_0601540 [Tanacetum coccineum]